MEHRAGRSLIHSRRALVALVVMRAGQAAPAGDAAIVEADFARMGFSGMDVVREMLALGSGFPIVVTSAAGFPVASDARQGVRNVVHNSPSLGEFCDAVRRMRNTGADMYLSVGV